MSVVARRSQLGVSFEAIDRQSGDMFQELSDTIEGLMQLSVLDQNDINQSRMSAVVRKYTGMDVNFTLVQNTWDAYCHFVEVDRNHVFFHQRSEMICHQTNNYKTTKIESIGSVNLKNGTVAGIFSKFPVKIGLGSLYLTGMDGIDSPFTADEVAAILIHEIGHAFTTFEYLGRTVMTGLVIGSSVRNTAGITDSKERTKVIMKAANNVNMMVDESFIAEALKKHGSNADVVLLCEHIKNMNKLSKTNSYDARNCEQIADQFAVKHGAAAALGSGLEKLHKFSYDINYRSTFMYVTMEIMKFIGLMFLGTALLGGGLIMIAVGLIVFVSANPGNKIYDDPKDRLIFLKRQLIDDLKQLDHQKVKNDVVIKDIMNAITSLDDRIEDVKDRKSFMTAVYDTITPWGRNREQQEAKQKLLEESLNNDLFITAAKLATI